MLEPYLPLLILLAISVVNAIFMVGISEVLNPRKATPVKLSPYESGIDPLGGTRERFSVKFYVVAILFIVFDVETVFLVPWAVVMREVGLAGFVAAAIFIFILTVGLIYEWKKGALEWDRTTLTSRSVLTAIVPPRRPATRAPRGAACFPERRAF
jgi:NADH-quinone oxidoreductase subunit A